MGSLGFEAEGLGSRVQGFGKLRCLSGLRV